MKKTQKTDFFAFLPPKTGKFSPLFWGAWRMRPALYLAPCLACSMFSREGVQWGT
jgi:hypothetical protein